MDHPPGRSAWGRAGRLVLLLGAGLLAAQLAGLAFAGFSYMLGVAREEDEVNWRRQPLEIVADDAKACVLNVDGVAPGNHEVYAFAMGSPATVLIKDPDGEVLFRASVQPGSEMVSEVRMVKLLDLGTHRVECHSGGEVVSAELDVKRARELAQG